MFLLSPFLFSPSVGFLSYVFFFLRAFFSVSFLLNAGVSSMQDRPLKAGPCRAASSMRAVLSMRGRLLNAGPSAQCQAVQGRPHNAGAVHSTQGRAQCRAARSTQGRPLNAGPWCMLNAGLDACSMQGRMRAQCRAGRVLYAGLDACPMQGRMRAQCRSRCPCRAGCHRKETTTKDSAQVQEVARNQRRSNH